MIDRAQRSGQTLRAVVEELCTAALEYERNPPPPDSPLERRVRQLLRDDPLLRRETALRIARAGGHDR